ncbi:MAG: type II toxin-antitoxin system prevent-host-death family antitoxin [Firmicutes bacterium]|nr:type II toxin-antitoxin system prevent-host-death family antitoxin [Bacillota bacterium]
MIITATELKANIGKYLQLAETQDIIVTKNNKPVVKLTGIRENKLEILDSLVGIIEDDGYTLEDARRDRLTRQ